jgi:hypothetical protein
MLASIQLATLGFELIETGASTSLSENSVGLVVLLIIVVGIIMLVVNRSFADAMIGLLGVAAAFVPVSLRYGAGGAMSVLVLAMLVLVLLGFIHGFVPGRD